MAARNVSSRVCYGCRGPAQGQRQNYAYAECGLKNVVLQNVMVYRCERCGSQSVDIPNMDGLHRHLALGILCKSSRLSGEEIRFLRGVAGLTATQLAKNICVTKNAVSRWENGAKISGAPDRAVRLACGFAIMEEIVKQRSGPVDIEQVEYTMNRLREFLIQFNSNNVLPGIRPESKESEKLLIDPEHPMSFSLLPQLGSETCPSIQ